MQYATKLHIIGYMNAKNLLRSYAISPTAHRIEVLEIIRSAKKPVDSAEVLSSLAKKAILIDRVTVFRILNLLVEKGVVNQLEFNEGKSRYELASQHHHHLICTDCGKVSCIEVCGLHELEQNIEHENRFTITSHRLEFFGQCDTCK